jgi:hypothetical protein
MHLAEVAEPTAGHRPRRRLEKIWTNDVAFVPRQRSLLLTPSIRETWLMAMRHTYSRR